MDLRLVDYDMQILNGDVSFVLGAEAIAQDITMRLRTFLGESVYDRSAGVPYLTIIFRRGADIATIENVLKEIVLATPGILTIIELTIASIDYQNRVLTVTGKASSINGEIDFSGSFEPL